MVETSEQYSKLEKLDTDQERLGFLEKRIVEHIKKIMKESQEEFHKELEERIKELGIDPATQQRSVRNQERILKKETDFDKKTKQSLISGLGDLRNEFEQNPMLKNYKPEFNALIDAVRTMYLSQLKIRHKEYQVMTNAPQLSDEEIKEQEALKEDMTESRALIQWYVFQNESNPEYLKNLFSTFRNFMDELGFNREWWGTERGLRQELGVLKLLKKDFKKVTPGEPKEDAHYAIDFWAETNNGTMIIFQSKSTSVFFEDGVYSEKEINALEKELSASSYAHIDVMYKKQSDSNEPLTPLVKLKKLQQDIKRAKEYAKSKGIEKPIFYLISCNANNFEDITGNPVGPKTASMSNKLWAISQNE